MSVLVPPSPAEEQASRAAQVFRKIIAGGPGRPTRLHSERGELMPASGLVYLPRTVWTWSRRRMTGFRPEEPWWPFPVIPVIESLLKPESRVLEFGSGQSTLWLARRAGLVVSIEDDPAWHRRVTHRLSELGAANATVRLAEGPAYYDLSSAGTDQFDFVVVDGSYRWLCIEAAIPRLKPGGALYFDNSDADKDLNLYTEKGMSRMAASSLEAYARKNPAARVERFVGLINGELHVGEGMLLTLN